MLLHQASSLWAEWYKVEWDADEPFPQQSKSCESSTYLSSRSVIHCIVVTRLIGIIADLTLERMGSHFYPGGGEMHSFRV